MHMCISLIVMGFDYDWKTKATNLCQSAANAELHVSKGRSPKEKTGMSQDNVFKDLVHARTSVEANCLFLLVDCLPTSWSVLSSLSTKTCADGDPSELFIWRRHTGNAEPAGWIFRNIFLGTWTFAVFLLVPVGCFSLSFSVWGLCCLK